MKTRNILKFILIAAIIFIRDNADACSLVKITSGGKTIVGNNEDANNPDTRIWFEPGNGKYFGVAYVGFNNLRPEGGINEAGLMFDAFAAPDKPVTNSEGKEQIFEIDLRKKIMRECKTVDEVKALVDKYNIYFWSHAVYVFVDKTGKYLAIEGDSQTCGDNNSFVQTNFRQSEIKSKEGITCWRYNKLMSMLEKNSNPNIDYCTALMDSVHQDKTKYTTIYDLNNCIIYLYYSRNNTRCVCFDLRKELEKGEKIYVIPELFPDEKSDEYNGMHSLKMKIDSLLTLNMKKDSLKISRIKRELKNIGYIEHVLQNYGYEFLNQNNIHYAICMFNLFIEFFPQSPDGYDYLGEAYMENKQYEEALNNYLHSYEIDPFNINAMQRISVINKLKYNR